MRFCLNHIYSMRKHDFWGFLEILDHLEKVSDHQSGQAERQNVDFPCKMFISLINRLFIREIDLLPLRLTTLVVPNVSQVVQNSLENLRNRVFASSRYGLKKISSKNINSSQSYSFRKIRDPRAQRFAIKKKRPYIILHGLGTHRWNHAL